MRELIRRFAREESGATMVEYAILVALIAVALITVIGILSGAIERAFQNAATAMNNA
ncbi:MAG TPA: Flp family type IVb pilin [Gammaproteobacteria bacterium]|nr:Flp family type IVb pilin [Gammaproteobacteria bacterium]